MNDREIKAFLTTAEKGSFLKAAGELHLSAVSVMNLVNSLESNADIKLFERTPKGVKLTSAGISFRDDMITMMSMFETAVKKAQEISQSESQIVHIGTSLLRPCKILVDMLSEAEGFNGRINIVPFDDSPPILDNILSSVDCFVSPCDSEEWRRKYSILVIGNIPCRIAVPRKHRLAVKKCLSWDDLNGERIMLVKQGVSPVLDAIRNEIASSRQGITIIDIPSLYDTSIFNRCAEECCLMETLDIWSDVHPSIMTLPVQWKYEMPLGIIYPKKPSKALKNFIAQTARILKNDSRNSSHVVAM